MTSTELKTSKNPKKIDFHTPFWANFFMNIRNLKKILIVMCVLHVLGLPLLMISGISYQVTDEYSMYGFIPLSILCLGCAVFCGFIIALNSFDYLYKKTKVDMIYSLPLTTKQHFLSDYFSGLLSYTIPYIVSVIIAFIIHGLACFSIKDWATLSKNGEYTSMMIKLSICGLFIMIMFYTLTILITTCCGSMFEAVAYNIIANGLIPGVIAVFFLIFFNNLYGINVNDYLLEYISKTSPIGACIGLSQTFTSDISYLTRWYVFTLIANVIYFFIAYFLYSKRKAEDVSKPFVFKAFYYVTMTAVTFVIIALMIESGEKESIAPMLFLSAITYFICEVISNRGFKKFGWSVIRYVATVCGVVVLSLVLKGTNGFGIGDKVPSASSIKSVSVNYKGLYGEDDSTYSYGDKGINFTDKDTINAVLNFNKDAIENHFVSYIPDDYYDNNYYNDDYYNYDSTVAQLSGYKYIDCTDYYMSVDIVYHTYLGRTISRTYNVSFEQYLMLKDLSINDVYIKKSAQNFREYLLSMYNMSQTNSYYNSSQLDEKDRSYYIDIYSKLQVNSKNYDNLSYTQIMQLADAYEQDLYTRTLADIMTPDDLYAYINGYVIFNTYKNTIQFLETNDFTPPSIETELQSYNMYNNEYNSIALFSPSDITCAGGDYYTSIDAYKITNGKKISVNSYSKLIELLKVAQPNYITTDECYILQFNGRMFVIPAKYSNLAEEIYKNSNSYYSQSYDTDYSDVDYLSCYLNVHDIWKNYYTNTYNKYNDFINDLMLGNVDIYNTDIKISATDFNILRNYYDTYWNIYYNSDTQNLWNDIAIKEYPNYDDFVWVILKESFNQEDAENLLFNDDITALETTLPTQEIPNVKMDKKVENMSNI